MINKPKTDTERLDWLQALLRSESGQWGVDFFAADSGEIAFRVRSSILDVEGADIRETIDNAINKTDNQQEEE